MIKYEKTHADATREKDDLRRSPIMRFMKHQDWFKFNIGDVLIKQTKRWHSASVEPTEDMWKTDTLVGNGAPRKYVYVFENELGIGYLKQLRVDGSGFTSQLICTVNFDPENTRFQLDPDYVDHMLVGEDGFQYNKEYLDKKTFRNEAIKENTKHLVNTRTAHKLVTWFHGLKVGDTFWFGDTWDDMGKDKYTVKEVNDMPTSMLPSHVGNKLGLSLLPTYRNIKVDRERDGYISTVVFTADHFHWRKVSMTKPMPLKDTLCGPQK